MEIERHYHGAWDGVQRQGHDLLSSITSVAQGLGGILQSHIPQNIPTLPQFPFPSDLPFAISLPTPQIQLSPLPSQWPWSPTLENFTQLDGRGSGLDIKPLHPVILGTGLAESLSMQHIGQDVSSHFGQAGATIGSYLADLAGGLMQRFPGPSERAEVSTVSMSHPSGPSFMPPLSSSMGVSSEDKERELRQHMEEVDTTRSGLGSKKEARVELQKVIPEDPLLSQQRDQEMRDISDEKVISFLAEQTGQSSSRSSAFVSTTFSSRTQDIETSVVARGDLWRVEATQGGATSPLFLLQLGPILVVRASTLLIPVHLSKRHCVWYGFDRKEGLHSLCPAVWSEQRRWLAMAMLSLNPVTCSFLDLQFPNGQLTYVAGDGVTGSAFTTALGGVLQAQGKFPGDTKLSYSYKGKWGTRLTPSVQMPQNSVSVEMVQPLAWQRVGMMVRPTVELSVTPTMGGRNPGTKVELLHSPLEKFSWGCGCVKSVDTHAFASISVGRSKRNGEHVGSSGLAVQLETPISNFRRTSLTVQLNSGIEF